MCVCVCVFVQGCLCVFVCVSVCFRVSVCVVVCGCMWCMCCVVCCVVCLSVFLLNDCVCAQSKGVDKVISAQRFACQCEEVPASAGKRMEKL